MARDSAPKFSLGFDAKKGLSWENVSNEGYDMTRVYTRLSGENIAGPYTSSLKPKDTGNKPVEDSDVKRAFLRGGNIHVSGSGQARVVSFPGGSVLPSISAPNKVDYIGVMYRLEFDMEQGLSWENTSESSYEMTRLYLLPSGEKRAGPYRSSLKPKDRGNKTMEDGDVDRAVQHGGILQLSGGAQTCVICFPGGGSLPSINNSPKVEYVGPEFCMEFDTVRGLSWESVADFRYDMKRVYCNLSGETLSGPYTSSLNTGDRGNNTLSDGDVERVFSRGGIIYVGGKTQACMVCFPGGNQNPSISQGKVEHAGPRFRLEFDAGSGLSWESVANFPYDMSRQYNTLSGEKRAGPYTSSLQPGGRGTKPMQDSDVARIFAHGGVLKVSGGGQTCMVCFPGGSLAPSIVSSTKVEYVGTEFRLEFDLEQGLSWESVADFSYEMMRVCYHSTEQKLAGPYKSALKPGNRGSRPLTDRDVKGLFEKGGILNLSGGGQTSVLKFSGGCSLPSIVSSNMVEFVGVEFRLEFDTQGGLSWENVAPVSYSMTRVYLTASGEKLAGPYTSALKPGDSGDKPINDGDVKRAFLGGGKISVVGKDQACMVCFPGGRMLPSIAQEVALAGAAGIALRKASKEGKDDKRAAEPTKQNEAPSDFKFQLLKLVFGTMAESAIGIGSIVGLSSDDIAKGVLAGIKAIEDEIDEYGRPEDQENLKYILHGRAAIDLPPHVKEDIEKGHYHGGPLVVDDYDHGHKGMTFDDFCKLPDVVETQLEPTHVCALRLYTTSTYQVLNGPVRQRQKPHPFAMTVYFLTQGIKQLRGATSQSQGGAGKITELWRGVKNAYLDMEKFASEGGCELAPMSTTQNRDVAKMYATSEKPVLFRYKARGLGRGVSLSFLSVYPKEAEFLYAPGTFLQYEMDEDQDGYKIIEVTPQMP